MSERQRIQRLEQELLTLRSDFNRLAVRESTSMPYRQVRIGQTTKGPLGSYPSSGTTSYVDFLDGDYILDGSPTYTGRGTQALVSNMAGELPPEGTVVTCYEWDGKWWCDYRTTTESGGEASRVMVVAEFSGTTPDTSSAPNDAVKAIDWANATVSGTSSSITFDVSDDSCTYDVGEYLLTANVGVDNDTADHNTSGTFYAAGHASEGHWKVAALLVRFERWNGSSWDAMTNGGYAYPGPDNFHQTVTFHQKLVVESPATDAKIRLAIVHPSSDSSDATMRVFHALWISEPIKQ